jgi:diacylglycerol O-acyltransferase / wax synthase
VKRLSGLDASFLYLETPNCPMHVASLMLFDVSSVEGGWSFERVRDYYASRLHLAPPFRRRLVEVPLGLHHPIWIEDPDFDVDFHVRRCAVPAPGDQRALERVAAELVAVPLDRSRPLWEVWVIEGMADGTVGILTKVHHACIDGVSGAEMAIAFLDLDPSPAPVQPAPWEPDHVPSDAEMVAFAMNSLAKQPAKALKAVRSAFETATNLRQANRGEGVAPPPSPFSAPRASWNGSLSPRRDYAMAELPLDRIKAVKNAFGCTVNDVFMGVVATALRSYLDDRAEALDGGLVAMIPMSVRSADQKGVQDNRVSMMLATLATDIDDPVERLLAISAGMQRAKEQQELIGANALQDWTEFAAPVVANTAARLYARMKAANLHRPVFNLTISNVPGPPFPLYSVGARMTAYYPMGPINDGAGLNVTVMSYMGKMDVGVVTDAAQAEAAPIAQRLEPALALLESRAHDRLAG